MMRRMSFVGDDRPSSPSGSIVSSVEVDDEAVALNPRRRGVPQHSSADEKKANGGGGGGPSLPSASRSSPSR